AREPELRVVGMRVDNHRALHVDAFELHLIEGCLLNSERECGRTDVLQAARKEAEARGRRKVRACLSAACAMRTSPQTRSRSGISRRVGFSRIVASATPLI